MNGNPFLKIQGLGRALMLPIAVLPVAGILLRLGQPDVLNIKMIADAGGAIFDNLPLLFAIGVAVGFAKDNNGVAALAGAIGYLIETAIMKDIDPKLNMGVLSGIIAGVVAGLLYNRYKDIKLPDYLAFFGGKRFVPIITGLVCVILGIAFGYVWQPVQHLIDAAGQWLTTAGAIGAFVFGFLNRLLLVTGLHHIINSLAWFVFGNFTPPAGGEIVHGDLHRFFAGDPTAGTFMAGFFPIMMFGLPAACLAMLHEAPKERRAMVGGLLFSMALTSFLTGVTEPIEFSFMFLAPVLYVIHAVLTGLSLAICQILGVKLGFTFSAGAIDYVLNYGLSTKGWIAIPLGIAYGAAYYGLFRFFIRKFNMATPGREPASADAAAQSYASGGFVAPAAGAAAVAAAPRAQRYIAALGGAGNLSVVDACTTRLRLTVVDPEKVSEPELKSIGARGVLKRGGNSVQVIIGPEADIIADEMRAAIGSGAAGAAPTATAAAAQPVTGAAAGPLDPEPTRWLAVFGGATNVVSLDAVAATRLRVVVRDPSAVDRERLGALDVAWVSLDTFHIVCGNAAARYAEQLGARLPPSGSGAAAQPA
ncbi:MULTISPECIES: N-acetylglucosamine-specific PTS transporter subunit IIBC [Burkholderia]|uniref:PTS N-acetyl-D-glucosamine transporter n=1 Tax=Burkholderia contaminans TaxID=488447 RepID=A0A2S5DVY4_9BURK|nr:MULTISPECIES: N-acetylglucosamine-specific PTS transporter subunit IIBC [Burkholderia]EKS9795281.1 PTS transporter subunit EIIC [Burkholderia cepacia]EKS9804355.1 PTS transporter subunit EIIC [Burkholderia cepacia]EKS9812558.1 PTS transporter subunit EIIC [Burkholderia cepacia]EKS9819903.1 PTS transporter subunit EIIC [Burkholderia cepacia]EKS9830120.1 PTS transporter subunit EIIC [Burkholderia cepacia]